MLDDRGARMVANPGNEVRSAVDIFVKDMGLVTDAARAKAYPTRWPRPPHRSTWWAELGRSDDSSVIDVFRGAVTAV